MKNFILIGAIGLIINISNVSASSIFVDNENDVQRVHRNVIRFCSYHSKQLLDLRNNNFDPTKCSRIFQELRRSDSDLIREFNDNPNYFIKDLSKTFSYLHKNNIEARKILGEENYNYFYAGLRYLDEIIYGFSLECKKQAKEKEESVSYDKKIKRNQNENYSSKKTNRYWRLKKKVLSPYRKLQKM